MTRTDRVRRSVCRVQCLADCLSRHVLARTQSEQARLLASGERSPTPRRLPTWPPAAWAARPRVLDALLGRDRRLRAAARAAPSARVVESRPMARDAPTTCRAALRRLHRRHHRRHGEMGPAAPDAAHAIQPLTPDMRVAGYAFTRARPHPPRLAARPRRHAAEVPGHARRGAADSVWCWPPTTRRRAFRRAVPAEWFRRAEGPGRRDRRQHARRRLHRAHALSDLRALSQSSRLGAALARDRLGDSP